ncbi:MAG: hypothetical protein Q9225_000353 [Loekoesia sp. 1 TL-2023]
MDSTPSTSSADASPSQQQQPSWATPTLHTNGRNPDANNPPTITITDPKKNPSAISIRAFFLGLAFGSSLTLTLLFLLQQPSNPLWRAPFFITTLSAFHFLEFYITAQYNPPAATTGAFLLTSNGYAYNAAHTLALLECIFGNYVGPRYFPERPSLHSFNALLPAEGGARTAWLMLGFALLVIGQGTRTLAMVHAATNFNHLIQFRKKEGHVLVTNGIYRWLRHPAYFGFFWWGLGTQIIMGNVGCLIGYAVVLWRFFKYRIEKEENLLIGFFGQDYVRYKNRTAVGIPLIP